jgi:hypothetical protein
MNIEPNIFSISEIHLVWLAIFGHEIDLELEWISRIDGVWLF